MGGWQKGRPPIDHRSKIDVEDRHREIIGAVAVLVIDIDDTQKFFAEIDFSGIVLSRACLDDHLRVERALEIGVELLNFFGLHTASPERSRLAASCIGKTAL